MSSRDLIVCAGVGGRYPEGVDRLEASLMYHGWSAKDMLLYRTPPPNIKAYRGYPYCLKLAALKAAVDSGATRILWLDASIVCVRNPQPMFDHIGTHGYFLYRSGYNCAQSVSDACLDAFGISRNQAELMPECASNVVGFDLSNPTGRRFFDWWHESALDGSMEGSREHAGQSADPRFLFHRQDQSTASLIAYWLKMHMEDPGNFACDYMPTMPPSIIFYRHGLYR